jgi:hypothetical protein
VGVALIGFRAPRFLGVFALLVTASCVTEPSAQLRSQRQLVESGPTESDSWSNLVQLGVQNKIGPDTEYRISERIVSTDVTLESPGTKIDSNELLHQPSLDLAMTVGALTWIQGYELQQISQKVQPGVDNSSNRYELLQKLEWRPEDFPDVTAWINYLGIKDDLFVDDTITESVLQLQETRGVFDYEYSFRNRIRDDLNAQVVDDFVEQIFRGTYNDEWVENVLNASISVFLNERQAEVTQATGGGGALQLFPIMGLSDLDTTPQISTLTSNPALIDNDTTTSAGINIGGFSGGGQINWNMGVEMTPGIPVELVRLYTASAVPNFLTSQFAFSVWTSDDNNFWTLASGSATYTYDTALRNFRISIPPVTSRYLKVVNTASPAAAGAVLVSEIQVFNTSSGSGQSQSNYDSSIRHASGALNWRPTPNLNLGYDLFVQSIDADIAGIPSRDEFRVDNGLNALWTPTEVLELSGRAQNRVITDPIRVDETFTYLNGVALYHPLQTLDFSVSYTSTKRTRDNLRELDTEATQVSASAQLLETLEAEVALEKNTQDDYANLRIIDRLILTGSLIAELTRSLDLNFSVRDTDATVTGPGAGGIPDPSEQRYRTFLLFKPSDYFTAEIRYEYAMTFAGEGLDQIYRLNWLPFTDGSIDFQLDAYRIDTGLTTGPSTDIYRLLTRWTVNTSTFFELNIASQVPDVGDRTDIVTLAFNFTQ